MADVTNELLFEVLKSIQEPLGKLDNKVDEVKLELPAIRTHQIAMQQDIHNIYATLTRHDTRLELTESPLVP